jgi:hypothetical protein
MFAYLCADLIAALASLYMHNLPHGCRFYVSKNEFMNTARDEHFREMYAAEMNVKVEGDKREVGNAITHIYGTNTVGQNRKYNLHLHF